MRQHAEQYKIDPNELAGYGYSAGGQLVALLGTTDAECGLEGLPAQVAGEAADGVCSTRLQCVVAGGAPCDFRALPARSSLLSYWLGGTRLDKPLLYEQASPASFITKDDPPMFFFHGAADSIVPLQSPQAMVQQLTAAGCQASVYVVPNAGHGAAFIDPTAAGEALKFLDAHLKPLAK
jgi:triacylglycerol lipase